MPIEVWVSLCEAFVQVFTHAEMKYNYERWKILRGIISKTKASDIEKQALMKTLDKNFIHCCRKMLVFSD